MIRDINRTQVFRFRVKVVPFDHYYHPDLLDETRTTVNSQVSGYGCELKNLEYTGGVWITGDFRMGVGAPDHVRHLATGIASGWLLSCQIKLQ